VEWWNKPRTWVVAGVVVAGLFLLQQLWHWEVERVEVQPNEFLVRIHLWGKDLGEDDIVAPDDSYKGVMQEVLPEGRHFLNPLFWRYEVHKAIDVPPGKCLVLTRKTGKKIDPERLARGEFLAGPGERGVVPEVRLPGKHRINPYEYETAVQDAVEVPAGQVGVRTLLWGKDPRELPVLADRNVYVVPEGYRGVQENPLPSGTYYFNPFVEKITPIDTQRHQAEFTDIDFPSMDGFHIKPHVLVVYQVQPAKAAELLVALSNKGELHQKDGTEQEKANNEILQKVMLPLIRGYVRIEGSKFDARDFVTQKGIDGMPRVNPRERLQQELMEKVAPTCKEMGILVESVTLAHMDMSKELAELADQIAERERTRVTREKNQKLVEQHKQDQELKAKEVLKDQKEQVVGAKTRLAVATKKAETSKEVEKKKLEQELQSAQIRLEAAENQARATLARARSEAAVITAQNEAEVAGLRTAVTGFPNADAFAQYHVLMRLAPALSEIFASDTSDFARIFSTYMTPGKAMPAAGRAALNQPAVAQKPEKK
jgi:regulator of protease activity HflC (stomatin/prohibitin superfamily)